MSADVAPQCRTCVDYWVKESKGVDEFLKVSRGGHIPEAHKKNYVQPGSKGSSTSHGRSNPNTNNGALPRDDSDQPINTEIIRLRNEVEALQKKFSKADQEIKHLKAAGREKRAQGLDSFKSLLLLLLASRKLNTQKKNPQKIKNKDSSTCMPVTL